MPRLQRNHSLEYAQRKQRGYWQQYRRGRLTTLDGLVTVLHHNSLGRARRKNCDYTLDPQWIRQRLVDQDYRCAVTGMPFTLSLEPGVYTPWKPSIDRLDNTLGYTPENVQIVVLMYNLCKNVATDDQVREFARAFQQIAP